LAPFEHLHFFPEPLRLFSISAIVTYFDFISLADGSTLILMASFKVIM